MKSSWEKVSEKDSLRAYVSLPAGPGTAPAIVVIQHQGGVDSFVQNMTKRIADAGYVAAAPDLYHRDGPECRDDGPTRRARLQDASVIEDVNATVEFLQRHSAVKGDRLGIVGFCMGGRVVYLMASASAKFGAGVAYYGGNIFSPWGTGPSPFERTAKIQCPLMGHFGAEDRNPSPEDMRKLDAELTKFKKAHEFFSYDGAGHAFMDDSRESYRRNADEASWPRTLQFFARHLSTPAATKAAASL